MYHLDPPKSCDIVKMLVYFKNTFVSDSKNLLANLALLCSSAGDGGEFCLILYKKKNPFSLINQLLTQNLYPLFPEFVEVILLPLDEFQTKIDREA